MLKFTLKTTRSILASQKICNKNLNYSLNKNLKISHIEKFSFSDKQEKNYISTEGIISQTQNINNQNIEIIGNKENNIFYHLNERNLIANISNKELITNPIFAREFLKSNPKMYVGFDPTSESLHLGNLVGIITALRFASFGVNPVFLIGGATGQIGDPSGKNKERPLLESEKVQNNLNFINSNIQKILQNICNFKDFSEFHKIKSAEVQTSDSSYREVLNIKKILRCKKNDISSKINNIDEISSNDINYSLIIKNDLLSNLTSRSNFNNFANSDNISSVYISDQINANEINKILLEDDKNAKKNDTILLNSKINLNNKKITIKYDIIDNMEFYKDLNIIDFLRNVGTSLRMGPMLSRESIKNRINSSDGISLTEFMYQTFQGYDYLKLYELFNVRIQIGGSDQWGNMLAGYELIKKLKNIDVVNCTFPLLTTANGQKFGKSEGNALFLNENMTPINNIYQYFYNIQDTDLEKLFYTFTFIDKNEIDDILNLHNNSTENRIGQKILAEKIVSMLYSEDEAIKCRKKCQTHYIANKIKLEKENYNIDEFFKEMEVIELPDNFLDSKVKISQFCLDYKLLETKAACKRLFESGSLLVNDNKIQKDVILSKDMLLRGKYFVIKTGKKHTNVFALKNIENLFNENEINIEDKINIVDKIGEK